MRDVPATAKDFQDYAIANLECALKQAQQGFPSRAEGLALAALKFIQQWEGYEGSDTKGD